MKQFFITISVFCAALLFCSCETKNEKAVEKVAFEFVDYYFSWHYADCIKLLTEDSKKWISFVASNISESEIVEYNELREEISYEITDVKIVNDSTAQAVASVENAVMPDNLDGGVKVINEPTNYCLTLRKENNKWLIVLDGPLTK